MTGRTDSSALLRAQGVAAAILGVAPAWLWDVAEGRILLASAAGIGFFDEPGLESLSAREFDMRRPVMAQLARMGTSLPQDGTPRLSLLRFFVGFRDVSVPCQCSLVPEAGRDLVLAVANIPGAPSSTPDDIVARATAAFASLTCPLILRGASGELYRNEAAAGLPTEGGAGFETVGLDLPDGKFDLVVAIPEADQPEADQSEAADAGDDAGEELLAPLDTPDATPVASVSGPDGYEDAEMPDVPAGGPASGPTDEDNEIPNDEAPAREPAGRTLAAAPERSGPRQTRVLPDTRRFTFLLDPDGRFAEVGAGFAALVGPKAADVVGRTWGEISDRFGLDPEGRVARALETHDTWSDVYIEWPTDFGERAELRLSALPRFAEGRAFVGFRGFADVLSVIADEAEVAETPAPDEGAAEIAEQTAGLTPEPEEVEAESVDAGKPAAIDASDVMFVEADERGDVDDRAAGPPNVHRLHKLQVVPPEAGTLNDQERSAFKAIAEALGARWQGEAAEGEMPVAGEPEAREPGEAAVVRAPAGVMTADTPEETVREEAVPDLMTREVEAREPEAGLGAEAEPEVAAVPADRVAEPEPAAEDAGVLVREVIDRIPLGLAVVRDERLLMANRAFLELFGYPDLEDLEVAGGLGALLEGRDADDAAADTAVAARRNDGSTFSVEARLGRTPWIDGPAMLMSVREARTSEIDVPSIAPEPAGSEAPSAVELQEILDTALDGIVTIDAGAAILSVNAGAARLFDAEAADLVGAAFADLIAEDDRAAVSELLDGLSAGVPSLLERGREITVVGPGGTGVPVLVTMARIGEDEPERFCVVLRDLSDWKETEADLIAARKRAEEASEQKSDFLAKMSHEIRTPLNGIIGFSEVILEERFGPLGNDRYREYVKDIRESGEHLMSLVNDLLDLSKVEAGKLDLSFTGVRLNDLVEQSVAIMQPQSNRARVIVRTSLAHALPAVVADARSIRQVLLNLLSNAIKFTPPGGQVIVSTALDDGGDVHLRVRDTGPGMSESDVSVALEPFRQLPVSPSNGEKGTGLGLPLAKALVEANRATFALQSKLNEGTLIEICFPQNRVLAE